MKKVYWFFVAMLVAGSAFAVTLTPEQKKAAKAACEKAGETYECIGVNFQTCNCKMPTT